MASFGLTVSSEQIVSFLKYFFDPIKTFQNLKSFMQVIYEQKCVKILKCDGDSGFMRMEYLAEQISSYLKCLFYS